MGVDDSRTAFEAGSYSVVIGGTLPKETSLSLRLRSACDADLWESDLRAVEREEPMIDKVLFQKLVHEARKAYPGGPPPRRITEYQFDDNQQALEDLLGINERDSRFSLAGLEAYLFDLAYVDPLQPDLFRFLFPWCLASWKYSLLTCQPFGVACEFHYSLWRGNVLDKMLTPNERRSVGQFFVQSLFDALDGVQLRTVPWEPCVTAWYWMSRLGSVGYVVDISRFLLKWEESTTESRVLSRLSLAVIILSMGEAAIEDEGASTIHRPANLCGSRRFNVTCDAPWAADTSISDVQWPVEQMGQLEQILEWQSIMDLLDREDVQQMLLEVSDGNSLTVELQESEHRTYSRGLRQFLAHWPTPRYQDEE